MKTVYIEGMMCPHCSGRVTELLRPFDANVVVSHETGTAIIADTADDAQIKEIIENAGYKVTDIK